ncbi:MAG: Crp/Fnr family transcriptional regulator [Acidobacteriota bacterium]
MIDKEGALHLSHLFGGLDASALAELAQMAHQRELARGELLFLVGEEAAGLFVVVAGEIRAYRVNSQGREQTLHVESAGATLAEVPVFDDGPYPATAVAETASTLLFLPKENFRRFMLRHPQVALTALNLMARRLRGHAELVDSLALQQVGQRLARFLLAQARDHGSRTSEGLDIEIPFSNEELAKRIGSVREVVSRTLSRMESDGLFVQTAPQAGKQRHILIFDEARLEQYGE